MIVQLTENHIAVVVPEDAVSVIISKPLGDRWHLHYDYPEGHRYTCGGFPLMYKDFGSKKKYPKELSMAFLSSRATEEDVNEVVEFYTDGIPNQIMHWTMYKNYLDDMGRWFDTAIESFQSLLQSKNITTPCAILKLEK